MRFATVLTVISNHQDIEIMKKTALPFARAHCSHLEVICVGMDATQPGVYFAGATSLVYDDGRLQAVEQAQALQSEANEALQTQGVLFDVQAAVVQPGTIGDMVAERSQFADIVILSPPYAPSRAAHAPTIVEAALFGGRAPVLITSDDIGQPERIVLAWNQSREAVAAARHALPFFAAAKRTDVLIVDPPRHSATQGDPGGDIARMLARHGGNPSVVIDVQTLPRVSDTLTRHVVDTEADLLVMGAYGHSRLSEAVLGGATRRMLEQSEVPLLLAH